MVAADLVEPSPTTHGGAAPTDGLDHDAPRPKAGVTFEQLIEFDHDKPGPFTLQEFYNHIFYLQTARVQGGTLQSVKASDFATKFKSILDKLSVLRRDPVVFVCEEAHRYVPDRGRSRVCSGANRDPKNSS